MMHNEHCCVTNQSNLQFAVHFLNMLTEAHADSTEQNGKLMEG